MGEECEGGRCGGGVLGSVCVSVHQRYVGESVWVQLESAYEVSAERSPEHMRILEGNVGMEA